jgi:anti-anti-sigma factor
MENQADVLGEKKSRRERRLSDLVLIRLDFVLFWYIFGALSRAWKLIPSHGVFIEVGTGLAGERADPASHIKEACMAANPVIRPDELKLVPEKKAEETLVRATGRITSTTSATLENTLRDLVSDNKRVVLDLTAVEYIDSSGLGALVSVYMHARKANCDLEIANPKQRIRDLFSRSRLASVFEGHQDLLGMTPD